MRTFGILLKHEYIQKKLKITYFIQKGCYAFLLNSQLSLDDFKKTLKTTIEQIDDLKNFINAKTALFIDKYDDLLPMDLVLLQYINNSLDLQEVKQICRNL